MNMLMQAVVAASGLTKAEAARRAGLSPQNLHRYCTVGGLSLAKLYEIADALSVRVSFSATLISEPYQLVRVLDGDPNRREVVAEGTHQELKPRAGGDLFIMKK